MWNLTSKQMPQSLSKLMGRMMEQVFSQTMNFKLLGFAVHEQLEDAVNAYYTYWPLYFIL